MMEELKVKFDEEQMRELAARVIEHFAIDNGNITEIVRCKDCKHWNITSDGFGECNVMDKQFLGEEYCSFGERKEDNER